jgi:hypothetical protein
VLTRMGNSREALALLLEHVGDVSQAIEFCQVCMFDTHTHSIYICRPSISGRCFDSGLSLDLRRCNRPCNRPCNTCKGTDVLGISVRRRRMRTCGKF